jgi:dTMP kinase
LFITLEGPDGSGKTTQITLLREWLVQLGADVLGTREPGGTEIGEQIRRVLHDVANTAMVPNTEILLYSASRAQLVGEVIRPALARGKLVLCDRYAESTMAYQGWGHGLDVDVLHSITRFATGGLRPDLIIYLDIDVEVGLKRKRYAHEAGLAELNRMDRKELAFHERVRDGYLAMATQDPGRWLVVNADRPIQEVHAEIRDRVELLWNSGVGGTHETDHKHRPQG